MHLLFQNKVDNSNTIFAKYIIQIHINRSFDCTFIITSFKTTLHDQNNDNERVFAKGYGPSY